MGRKTKQNHITSPELIAQINPENIRLKDDFLCYLQSVQRSPGTIRGYDSDLLIFFTWNLQHNNNKPYVKVSKRDIIAYQNWLLTNNENSPARIRRLKAALASLGNYVENILDDEYPDYRQIVRKVESPENQPVREKTVLSDEQLQLLLDTLVGKKKYMQACAVALAAYSGARKSELLRFKVEYFRDENLVCSGALWKTNEKIKTKGRGLGKFIHKYVLVNPFKPYLDLWLEDRKNRGIESEWLFPAPEDSTKHAQISTLDGWTTAHSNILGVPIYFHAYRHYFTTMLAKQGLPDTVIQNTVGWTTSDMVNIYKDIDHDDELENYFADGSFKTKSAASWDDLGKAAN